MCQSPGIKNKKFKNMNVAFFRLFRECRQCKQSFIFENLLHKPLQHYNKNINESKHARIVKKPNDL